MDLLYQDELIDGRIGVHDSQQFEVKLDYTIDPARRKNRYQVEAFFFIPRSLGINALTYPRAQFYSDVQAHIRFKTPVQPLRQILDPDNERSPLTRIARVADKIEGDRPDHQRRAQHELRMLGCLLRAGIRDRASGIRRSLQEISGHAGGPPKVLVGDVEQAITSLIEDTSAATDKLRNLRPSFQRSAVPAWVREAFEYTDEYASLVMEFYFSQLIERLDGYRNLRSELDAARQKLVELVVSEVDHRRGANYGTQYDTKGDNEKFEYRRGLLKKFASSVLFLEISKEEEGGRAANIAAAGAAAVAMLFAAIVAIVAQSYYGINTIPFVVALVVSYIFKDRIKEWLRYYLRSKMSRFLADYNVKIRDPANDTTIGRCRESFNFVALQDVPAEILAFRHKHATSVVEAASKPEVCFHYAKRIEIRGDTIDAIHGRLRDINDIIRVSVASFLPRTDDPLKPWLRYSPTTDAVESVELPKVYHLNIVLRLHAELGGSPATMERVRVVLDRTGIRRLEEVR